MLVSQHTMEQTISKMLTELNFPDMKYEITKEFDRWVIRLNQTEDVVVHCIDSKVEGC